MAIQLPTDRNLQFPAGEIALAVGIGAIPGWTTFRKFGMNPDIDPGTEEVWPAGVLRVLPTVGGQLSVVSDSAEDGAGTLTGALTITVEGLDSDYEQISETITLNGLTPVPSVGTDWFRVNRAYNVTAGSNEVNVGSISISIGGNVQAFIELDQGQTHQTHYTVPAGKTLIVTSFHYSGGRMGNTDMQVWSQVKLFGTDTAWRTKDDVFMYQNNFDNDVDVFLIPEKSEIRQRIIATTTNAELACTYSGYLVDNSRQGNFG
jgi:hypothetical protein